MRRSASTPSLKEQPDLNWRNPAVEAAMFDVLRFRLDRGVDGFRLDVVRRVMKTLSYAITRRIRTPAPRPTSHYVLGNHDESRVATRLGSPAQARLAMLLVLTLRGTPPVYYGDELGMQDVPIPPEQAQDPWGKNVPDLGLGRDPARTPRPSDRTSNAGFCPPDVTPWLTLGGEVDQVNVAAQLADPRSMLSLTRRLLALRRASPALLVGRYRPLDAVDVPDDCFFYRPEADSERLLVALNFGGRSGRCDCPTATVR